MLPLEYHYHYFSALTHTKLKPYQPFSRANSRVSLPSLDDTLRCFRCPILPNVPLRYGLWGHHRSSWACRSAGEPDSAADSGEEKTEEDDAGSNRRKDGWWSRWRRWRWQPLIQVQEIGILLLQIGIGFFVMRLLRPGIPLPGSDPKAPTVFVSVPYSEFLSRINGDQVQKVEVDGVHIMFKLKAGVGTSHDGGGDVVAVNGGGSSSSNITRMQESESLVKSVAPTKRIVYTTTRPSDIRTPYEKMLDNKVEFGSPDKRSGGFFNSALIALFYAAVLAGLLHRVPGSFSQHTAGQIRNRKSGTSAGRKSSEQGETVTFADIAGVDEAKEELEEIVEFLRNPDRYVRLGARPPRGVLLVGLPGTGKTLLAKAVAGEADVPFISCSASEFVELYVGMGASRVRDLFARAKKEAPAIIFIDEIDAVAKSRDGKFRMVSNDEREQTLNQLLTEMDGFDSNSAVIVLGATNRSDVLDPALRRPGRFDRVVMVETPDRIGREAILKVHVSKKELPLAKDVDLGDIACMTTGFTGADLANLVNEAALLAGRQNKTVVEKLDFIQAVERSIAGIEKKTAKLRGSEKAVVARHEAGHAVVGTAVAKLLPGQPRVEAKFKAGIPHCCKKDPTVVDLLPGTPYNQQIANCCKGGVLNSWGQDPSSAVSSFQISVGSAGTTNKTVKLPKNFTLKAPGPGYTCGPAKVVKPTTFITSDKRRTTQAMMTWNITCTYSQFLAQKTPSCCVSLSSFYNDTVVNCPTCTCGCQNKTESGSCVEPNSPHLASVVSSSSAKGANTPLVQCTSHMCPIRVHWHVKLNYKEYWRVKITITNFNYRMNYSQWNLVVQHPNLDNITQLFSFQYKSLTPYEGLNDTSMLWGIKFYNDFLSSAGPLGNVQSEILLRKDKSTFTFDKGWAFPRRIYFNGDNCVMPPPDAYPWLPNASSKLVFSVLCTLIATLASLLSVI